jgi:hypothetical protein
MAFGFTHDGHFTWKGVTEVDVSRLMGPSMRDEDRNEREEAKDFLKALLADGPVLAEVAQKEAKPMGLSTRTVNRAKADLGVVSARFSRPGGRHGEGEWKWYMPEPDQGCQPPCPTGGNLDRTHTGGNVDRPSADMKSSTNGAQPPLPDQGCQPWDTTLGNVDRWR